MKLFSMIFLLTLASCSSKNIDLEQSTPSANSDRKLSTIEIVVDPNQIYLNQLTLLGKMGIKNKVDSGLRTYLKDNYAAYDETGDYLAHITIDKFRVRTGASKFFLHWFSGKDFLNARVRIFDHNRLLVGDYYIPVVYQGGPFSISMDYRSQKLIDKLVSRIGDKFASYPDGILLREGATRPEMLKASQIYSYDDFKTRAKITKSNSFSSGYTGGKSCSGYQMETMEASGLSRTQIRAACR